MPKDVHLVRHLGKVMRNKPSGLFDACFNKRPDVRMAPGRYARCCLRTGLSRMVPGGPNTDDVFKWQLKPLNRADYSVTFTDAQWARIQQTFPSAVCDFSKIGVGQQPPITPWLTFTSGPDGTRLGPPPTLH